jgi:Opacity-associated protein A LysM-like domain
LSSYGTRNSEGIAVEDQSSVKQDYKHDEPPQRHHKRSARHHYFLLLAGALIGLGVMLGFTPDTAKAVRSDAQSLPHTSDNLDTITLPLSLSKTVSDTYQNTPPTPANVKTDLDILPQTQGEWHTVSVQKGDNLALIFNKIGLSAQQLHSLLSSEGDTAALKQIYPGDELKFFIDSEKQLKGLVYNVDETRT